MRLTDEQFFAYGMAAAALGIATLGLIVVALALLL